MDKLQDQGRISQKKKRNTLNTNNETQSTCEKDKNPTSPIINLENNFNTEEYKNENEINELMNLLSITPNYFDKKGEQPIEIKTSSLNENKPEQKEKSFNLSETSKVWPYIENKLPNSEVSYPGYYYENPYCTSPGMITTTNTINTTNGMTNLYLNPMFPITSVVPNYYYNIPINSFSQIPLIYQQQLYSPIYTYYPYNIYNPYISNFNTNLSMQPLNNQQYLSFPQQNHSHSVYPSEPIQDYKNIKLESLNSMELFEFACFDYNKSYITNLFDPAQTINNSINNSMNSSLLNKNDLHSLALKLFEIIKFDCIKYITNLNASSLFIKLLKHLNFSQRSIIWKAIEENNFFELSKNSISSNVIINIINSLTERAEEHYITCIITNVANKEQTKNNEKEENTFTKNMLFLATENCYTVTVLQSIFGRFNFNSLSVYLNFVETNFLRLIQSNNGKMLVSKYIRILRSHPEEKKKTSKLAIKSLSEILITNNGVDIVVEMIEDWGATFIKKVISECYNNKFIFYYKDNPDIGINRLFSKLIWHVNKVSFIINK